MNLLWIVTVFTGQREDVHHRGYSVSARHTSVEHCGLCAHKGEAGERSRRKQMLDEWLEVEEGENEIKDNAKISSHVRLSLTTFLIAIYMCTTVFWSKSYKSIYKQEISCHQTLGKKVLITVIIIMLNKISSWKKSTNQF